MQDIPLLLPVAGYGVAEWHPTLDGSGKPTALLLRLQLAGGNDGAEVVMRITSRAETNRLIAILERHRDNVWPVPRGPADLASKAGKGQG